MKPRNLFPNMWCVYTRIFVGTFLVLGTRISPVAEFSVVKGWERELVIHIRHKVVCNVAPNDCSVTNSIAGQFEEKVTYTAPSSVFQNIFLYVVPLALCEERAFVKSRAGGL